MISYPTPTIWNLIMNHPVTEKMKLLSVGTFLPDEIVKSEHLFEEIQSENQYGIPVNWMPEKMGIYERRLASAEIKPSELAIPAAQEAIDIAGINPDLIDLVIFCGIERDFSEPATAHIIQHKLGLKAHYIFDVANACYGFIDGLEIANSYIRSGMVKHALVVTGEVPSRVLRSWVKQLKSGLSLEAANKLIGGLSVGDAGGAAVLGATEPGESTGFSVFNKNVDSSLHEKCHYKVRDDGVIEGQMLMARMSVHGFKMHKQIIPQTLARAGWKRFDYILSHQPGKRNFEQLASLNIAPKRNIIKIFKHLGNTTSATFPLSFKKMCQDARISSGDRIGGCFAGSGLTIGQFCYTF